jgi:hypothetical protein
LFGTPSVHSIHAYYPFAMMDGGRLAPMAAELVDHLSILGAVRRFPGMGGAVSRSLRSDIYVRMQHFVLMFLFGAFWGMCDVNSCIVFLLIFMALWVPISATLFRRAVLTLWPAFLFLWLTVFSSFLLFAWWPPLLFLVRNFTERRHYEENDMSGDI